MGHVRTQTSKGTMSAEPVSMSPSPDEADDPTLCEPLPNAQAKQVFQQHQTEIQRRREAAHNDTLNPASFTRVDREHTSDFPFHLPGQDWLLYSVSHVMMPPVSEDPRAPAVRIYGTFESAEEAIAHGRQVSLVDPTTNLQVARTHQWVCMSASPERLRDTAAVDAHVRKVVQRYEADRKVAGEEFERSVSKHEAGRGLSPDAAVEEKALAERAVRAATTLRGEEASGRPLTKATRLPRNAEVRDQTHLVCGFLPDPLQAVPEPLFVCLGAFPTQQDCDLYVRNTAGEHVRDVDLYAVSACEWLFPQRIDGAKITSEVYRSAELSNVMSNHKSQPQKVEAYRKWLDDTKPASSAASAEAASDAASDAPPVAGPNDSEDAPASAEAIENPPATAEAIENSPAPAEASAASDRVADLADSPPVEVS